MHRITFAQGVGRVVDHAVGGLEALVDHQAFTEVEADMDGLQVDVVVPVEHGDLRALGAKDQGAGGNADAMGVGWNRQGRFGVVTGQQFAVGVVGDELREQGAGAPVDGGGVADQAGLEVFAGMLRLTARLLRQALYRWIRPKVIP